MGGPYPSEHWALGGRPTLSIDVPVTAVFLALFLMGAVTHMTISQLNRRRKHRFPLSIFIIGFSMSRVIACVLRIAAICEPRNLNLSIASLVFLNAGVVLIYLLNLVLARRIIRALYPRIGWHPVMTGIFWALCILIVLTVAMVLTVIIQSFFTSNFNTLRIDRDIQLYALTCFTVVSFLPLPVGMLTWWPYAPGRAAKYFGQGSLEVKGIVLSVGSFVVCLGAAYRCATVWMKPTSIAQAEPGYDDRGFFYVFYFTMDILVITLYGFSRVDKLFFILENSRMQSPDALALTTVAKEEDSLQKP